MTLVLVTGGCGFVGSHLVRALAGRGDRVRVLDDLSTGRRDNLPPNAQVELRKGDVADYAAVEAAMTGCEVVFHQAALASVPRSISDPLATHAADATGTLHVLEAARRAGVRRVIYAGSSSAYGNQPTPRKSETDLPSPLSPYAAAKLGGELYCQAYWHSYGLETVALRYFNVFGPGQDPTGPYAAVIPLFILRMLAGQRPTIYGDGRQTRDFTFVGNVAAGRVFNIGSGQAMSLLDLVAALNRILGTALAPMFEPSRTGDVRDSLADISLAQQMLGYCPDVSFEDGLERTVAFYRSLPTPRAT
jgi:UDP-glucose 4-epimerase